jgi:outer membrane protein assembly factor BamB
MPWLASVVAVLLTVPLAAAADWPQWLGPQRDGATDEKVPPWKGKLSVVWRQKVGEGHSSPVVAGGLVYLHTKVKDKEGEAVTAYDAITGKEKWQSTYPRDAYRGLFGNGPRATPLVAGSKVYAFGINGILSCLDAKDGKVHWRVNTVSELHAAIPFFGASCSPILEGELVLMNIGAKGASIVAFGKDNGEVAWKALNDKASYSSPILIGKGPERQAIFLTAQGVVSLAPATGKVFWQFPLLDKLAESSSTPMIAGDTLIASSITTGCVGLRLERKDSMPAVTKEWNNEALTCYFATPVAVGKEHVYMVTGTKPPAIFNTSTLRCIEAATGKELWKRANVGKYHASLLRTGDNKLLLLEENGDLVLVEPDPKGYRELARSKICGSTWAHPAVANGRLYIRDGAELLCVQLTPCRASCSPVPRASSVPTCSDA